jgi:hypothetical protein
MYFLRGALPWQGLKIDKKADRYRKIYEKKKSTSSEELCKDFPSTYYLLNLKPNLRDILITVRI